MDRDSISSNSTDYEYDSIFDQIESEQVDPLIMCWRTPTQDDKILFTPKPINEGNVFVFDLIGDNPKEVKLRLVPRALIKFKVF